jgi:proline dehydrogenase
VLRAIFIYLSKARWARRLITGWRFSRRAAARFVAGDNLDEAIAAVRALNQVGISATLDHLGENVTTPDDARRAAADYMLLFDRICETGVRANASLKLTQLGLGVDYDLCLENVRQIARRAADCGIFVRIDMEDSSTVDRTLQIYHRLRGEGLTNVGLVLQAYLYRSLEDARALLADGAKIRLCKGAYNEPPDQAFPRKADVDANYDEIARTMIEASRAAGAQPASSDGRFPPAAVVATHDARRIAEARRHADQAGLPKTALEFQMLYGIRPDLQRDLVAAGHPVRVYVPYGTEWYPYFMRRLAERPANLWFFLSNLFRR